MVAVMVRGITQRFRLSPQQPIAADCGIRTAVSIDLHLYIYYYYKRNKTRISIIWLRIALPLWVV